MTIETWLPALLGYLIPIGFFLLGWGGMRPKQAHQATTRALSALAVAVLGYFAVGFAFHLGGAAVVADLPGLEGLNRLINYEEGALNWGLLGVEGFFLAGGADSPAARGVFVNYLPLVITAVLLPTLSLDRRVRGLQVLVVGLLVAALIFPLVACWAWGGGWLAALGLTVERGHGLVDYAGSGIVYLIGGLVAMGGMIAAGRREESDEGAEMPPAHFPLLANLGFFLFLLGWMGWSLSVPFHTAGSSIDPARVAISGILAVSGAVLTCLGYCWLTLGRADPLMMARAAAAGLVAVSASAPFIPPWAALAVGAVAGVLLPVSVYVVNRTLRLRDRTAAVAMTVLAGALGLLAVGFFADGVWGQGWNGVGLDAYREVAGQGVTGFLAAAPFLGDGPGQTIAQLLGLGVIVPLGFIGGWLPVKLPLLLVALSKEIAVGARVRRRGDTTPETGRADDVTGE
jgi:Amt family ammonium transporter